MKRTKIKKLSPAQRKRFIRRADRALQDFFRATYPDERCESCGNHFDIMHHAIEKSKSSLLRYEIKNLVFLCSRCHAAYHLGGDMTVMGRVIAKRGIEWFKWLDKARRPSVQLDRQLIERSLNKLGIKIE